MTRRAFVRTDTPVSGRLPSLSSGPLRGLLLAAALLMAACGDGGDTCPSGFTSIGGVCQPPLADGAGGGPDTTTTADSGRTDVGERDGIAPDGSTDALAPDTDDLPDAVVDANTEDVPPPRDVPAPTGAIGDPCRRDRDCQDGFVCLGWSDGYCTVLGCDVEGTTCPAGSTCLRVEAGAAACFRTCGSDADCRDGGDYSCKTLADSAGDPVPVCHEIADGAGSVGAACASHAECAGTLTCVRSLPGGACLPLFCTVDSDCDAALGPGGGVCARHDGVNTCLIACATDGDCAAVGDGTLTCETRRNTGGQSLSVCVSGQAALPIGAACIADGECASGDCETLGDGRCTIDDLPCFTSSECPAASTCVPIEPPVSACSAPCGEVGQSCPVGVGACVFEIGGSAACRPACRWDAGHSSHDCRPETGWTCVFGVPLREEERKGYYCAPVATGRIGAPCATDDACADPLATCLRPVDQPEAATGYCSRACSPQQPCPFGTWCLQHGAALRCQKVCFSPLDCAEGDTCRPGTPYGTCGPE